MATKKKMLQAAAGNAGGAALNVEDLFSTYLYDGNGDGSAATNVQTINNGIDLSGEGGMVWIKGRSHTTDHIINDTVRGAGNTLQPNLSDANQTGYYDISQFNSNGFGLDAGGNVNANGYDYASWTFRKAPKFFDVVTWTGDGTNPRTISHNLDAEVGMMVIKRLDTTSNWHVYHRSWSGYGEMNLSNPFSSYAGLWPSAPTSTTFTLDDNAVTNASGSTYVAYLFAHNNGDGEFGPDGDADIIKCGSYTGTGSVGLEVDLGFEPQWILWKNASQTSDWNLYDNMRSMTATSTDQPRLIANTNVAESNYGRFPLTTATGFIVNESGAPVNSSGDTHIYIAIRRGTKVPESGTEVFGVGTTSNGTLQSSVLSHDAVLNYTSANPGWQIADRMRGFLKGFSANSVGNTTSNPFFVTNSNAAESTSSCRIGGLGIAYGSSAGSWRMSDPGVIASGSFSTAYFFRRAPNYFDVVAYTGDGVAGRTVSHNLGVAPELLIVKRRDSSGGWKTYVESLGPTKALTLNETVAAENQGSSLWNSTSPTADVFTVGTNFQSNTSGGTYIAYLFASLPGISKVGSYTGNGSSQTIDCGFTSGARFVLGKRTDSASDWYLFDSVRGITTSYDPYLALNLSDAEATVDNIIRPDSSGFALGNAGHLNQSGGSFIFYAIA